MQVTDRLSREGMLDALRRDPDVQMLLRMVKDAQDAFMRQYDKDHSVWFHLGKRLLATHWADLDTDGIDRLCQA